MIEVEVIEDPAAATVALEPVRNRLLAELAEPASAAMLAARIGIPRQKVNYHLRALEMNGLAQMVEERHWGGLSERLLVATASSYVVSPHALGLLAADPGRSSDRLSAGYLIALGSRIVREVGDLWRRARQADKGLATLSIDTEIRFRSPADRAAFTQELTRTITSLVARYHNDAAPGGRLHRLVLVSHPLPSSSEGKTTTCQ